ncbi:MAG: S41 family peptidase [Rhodospirillaceae bacterium]
MRARKAVLVLPAILAVAAGFLIWERLKFDRAAWLADYEQLRTHASRNYANLLWVIDERGLDPAALHRATLEELAAARTDRAARAAIASFISAFQDAHFRIARTPLSRSLENLFTGQAEEMSANTSAEKACAALGFRAEEEELAFGLASTAPAENSFPSATFQLGSRAAAILRIPIFDQKRYRPACERAWRAHIGPRRCDRACTETFVQTVVPNQLLSELTAQVRAFGQAGVALLVIDVTSNGGGTDWVEPAARIIANKQLACAYVSFIKGPHWLKTFSAIVEKIDRDLRASQNSGDVALLQVARRRAQDLADRASASCALDTLWIQGQRPACSNLVDDAGYTACGLMGPLPKGSLARATAADALFHGLGYDYAESVFAGRVAVLIDRHTASAAEYFAAILADNDAAVLVGERSFGLGCGYTGGGAGVLLTQSGLKVDMPDCQRLRRDGTNEMAGIAPRIAAGWQDGDDDDVRWSKVTAALASLAE